MDGEDDLMFDSPPYYHFEDEHSHRQYPNHQMQHHIQHQMQRQSRSQSFAGKSAGPDLPAMSSSTSSLSSSRHGRERDQEQVEEALRASLSTLLATGPRPKFKQRRNRPRKIYTVDNRSQRSSVPASPTHLYYSTNASPHLVPTNPDNMGDLSPHYFHGTLSPYSRDYDSASSDSEQVRQKKAYPRGILSTGESSYSRAHDHYYEIESSTLNSNDPPFSGSTTPYSPLYSQANKCTPGDHVTKTVLQGPSSLLAARYVSWSVKAQSILDHVSKDTASIDGHSSASSSASSSPHSSPSTSGASTPSRIRRKRCPIPEPHQGFFSRALDQRSLASHVSVSRVGMAGINCSPLHLGLRAGVMIRGSSPLRPTTSPMSPNTPSTTPPYQFSARCRQDEKENGSQVDIEQGSGASDDKENKRWYGQEIGLNLWQTTLGAAVLLGTGFGTGSMVKKQSEQSLDQFDADDQTTLEEPEGSTLLDAEVPSLAHESTLESSVRSLRERFLCIHPLAEKVKRRQERIFPARVHPADEHHLPPDPNQLPTQEKITDCKLENLSGSTVNRYSVLIVIDPMIILDGFPSLGNQLINDYNSILPDFHVACNGIVQSMLDGDTLLFSEQVRLRIRLQYLPSAAKEVHLPTFASALAVSQESKLRDKNIYTGFFSLWGFVSSVSLTESVIYSQVFLCMNRRCQNRNYLCFTPSSTSHRIIKRTEEQEFMETSTNATLLDVDLLCGHCGENMPESLQDRVYMNQQRLALDCVNESSFEGVFHNQITVVLKDDLAGTVVLGEEIQLLGNLTRVFPENSKGNAASRAYKTGILFEVNNVIRPHPPEHQMPECISSILENGVVPSHVYRKLKLALLLSAVSLEDGSEYQDQKTQPPIVPKDEVRPAIHVMVLMNGYDTIVPHLVHNLAAGKRSVRWDHGAEASRRPLFSVTKATETDQGAIEASILGRARDGTLLLSINKLDKKGRSDLTQVLNGDDIQIQRHGVTQALDLRCSCWAFYTQTSKVPSRSAPVRLDSFQEEQEMKGPANDVPMHELFDLVILQHETPGATEISKSIAMAVLEKSLAPDSASDLIGQNLTRDDFSHYIRMASKVRVRLSTSCYRLLQEYFQILRKGMATNHLQSVATMSTLLRIAACHAKLSFRTVADMDDALVSIIMVEETMAARFGMSRLGFVPLPDGEESIIRLYGDHVVIPTRETDDRDEGTDLPRMCPRSIDEERDEMLAKM
ncbi:Minichromosome maintenance domain-containing protein 2 [Podila minutissima]|uniref:Minichromosome maintenance domain-containing protein 2 n=1 Tax=Podila minutissima TaxID=64525 RepID=A0A9P5SN20_9FUNG|nr:Minichromosome maintenance domain-containing protein 2 [Podila minutissima]